MDGIQDLISSAVNHCEVWVDSIFVKPEFEARLSLEKDFKTRQKMLGQRAVRLVYLCGESVERIDKVDSYSPKSVLQEVIMSENVELLKRLIDKGASVNKLYTEKRKDRTLSGITVFHYAAMRENTDVMKLLVKSSSRCPCCDRTNDDQVPVQLAHRRPLVLKSLIHDCLVEVATFDITGWTPLHRIALLATTHVESRINACRPFDSAMLVLEADYQRAVRGAPWFNVKSTKALLTARGQITGLTALEFATSRGCQEGDRDFIELLTGWESSPLAIPPPTCPSSTASLVLNPKLTPFQSFLAHGVCDLLHETAIHSVLAYQVLGYLTPMDVLSNWNEWCEDIATPNPVPCYSCSLRNK